MKTAMCAQVDILEKIHKAGKVNGFAVELAEAQARDFMKVQNDIKNLKQDVSDIKTEQARQGGMIESIFNYINSPIEEERAAGQKWNLIVSITKHKAAWVILAIVLMAFSLAGEKLSGIIEKLI
jgi:hypothetical protein